MTEIHASYRRTFQVKPYETEVVELSVTDDIAPDLGGSAISAKRLANLVQALYAALALVGDQVVTERMHAAPRTDRG